jgi:hypothetical protein
MGTDGDGGDQHEEADPAPITSTAGQTTRTRTRKRQESHQNMHSRSVPPKRAVRGRGGRGRAPVRNRSVTLEPLDLDRAPVSSPLSPIPELLELPLETSHNPGLVPTNSLAPFNSLLGSPDHPNELTVQAAGQVASQGLRLRGVLPVCTRRGGGRGASSRLQATQTAPTSFVPATIPTSALSAAPAPAAPSLRAFSATLAPAASLRASSATLAPAASLRASSATLAPAATSAPAFLAGDSFSEPAPLLQHAPLQRPYPAWLNIYHGYAGLGCSDTRSGLADAHSEDVEV